MNKCLALNYSYSTCEYLRKKQILTKKIDKFRINI